MVHEDLVSFLESKLIFESFFVFLELINPSLIASLAACILDKRKTFKIKKNLI